MLNNMIVSCHIFYGNLYQGLEFNYHNLKKYNMSIKGDYNMQKNNHFKFFKDDNIEK